VPVLDVFGLTLEDDGGHTGHFLEVEDQVLQFCSAVEDLLAGEVGPGGLLVDAVLEVLVLEVPVLDQQGVYDRGVGGAVLDAREVVRVD
jgi:hypothetical protein